MRHPFLVAAALAGVAPPTPAQSAPDTTRIPLLHGEALAFDAGRGTLVVFGGARDFQGTWAWSDAGWRQVADSAASPPLRFSHAMGYDPAARRVVLFGGVFGPPPRLRCDTWALEGGRWSRLSDGPCPTDRVRNPSLVFDTRRRRMLLVDGPAVAGDTARPLRLWEWNRDAWRLIDSLGPRRTGFAAVAWDPRREVLVVPVLFGGPDAGLWEWDGATWRHSAGAGPSLRQFYGLAWDGTRGRTVLIGGQGGSRGPYLDDAWTWDGARWEPMRIASAALPPPRGGASLLEDPAHRRLLYFGGYNDAPLDDFWALAADGWHRLRR